MEALYCTAAPFVNYFSVKAQPHAFSSQEVSLLDSRKNKSYSNRSLTLCCYSSSAASAVSSSSLAPLSSSSPASSGNRFWVVHMRKPPQGMNSKAEIVDYYVETLEKVLGSLRDAQMSIYGSSTYNHFWFCCDIDEEASRELARLPGVLSVRPDPDYNSIFTNQMGVPLFSPGTTKHWMVRLNKPGVGIVTKAQMAGHCVKLLTKVLGNESDAQMCIYHISWQSGFGFCCELDDEAAKELAGVPGVLAISPDRNFESQNKDYGGKDLQDNTFTPDSSKQTPIKTKKLFVTGLSFYTSEKTLRAAFEGFGELVGVKIIMDKISKRSKGYAFVEYTTEESASSALKEMNGKIINGWMIVVDVAKPSKHSTRQHIRQV